jgi:DNA modification methylase
MEVIEKEVTGLIPYASNSRTHDDAQVAQIAASIKEFGFNNPVLIDETGGIIAGHGRVLAARKLSLDKVPTIELAHLTPNQRKAYVIADNKLALNAGWDMEMLSLEMGDLDKEGFDLSLIGFDDNELAAILADKNEGLTDPDEVPDLPDDPVTKEGDVWLLGTHRLMCGSSTVETDVSALLAGVKPHLMVTDPPYGVEYDPSWHLKAAAEGKIKGAGKRGEVGLVQNDDCADWAEAYALFPGDVAYVWHASIFGGVVGKGLTDCGFEIRSQIVWAKSSFAIGRGHYHWQHETCWYAVKKGGTGSWHGDRSQSTVWKVDKQKSDTGHGTQKPVECMKRPIENNSSPGQAVYEPFSGSGTTIIAGEMTGRCIYAMELSPAYVDVAVKRWQDFTGEKAKLEDSGQYFPSIKADAA